MSEPRGRPFEPGNTVGRGRPKGSRNRPKSPAQELLNEFQLLLTKKCIQLAMNGDGSALRLCMERIVPVRRDPVIRLKRQPVRTIQDLELVGALTIQAIQQGGITPAEGEKMMNVLESHSRIIGSAELEQRIENLERKMPAGPPSAGGNLRQFRKKAG